MPDAPAAAPTKSTPPATAPPPAKKSYGTLKAPTKKPAPPPPPQKEEPVEEEEEESIEEEAEDDKDEVADGTPLDAYGHLDEETRSALQENFQIWKDSLPLFVLQDKLAMLNVLLQDIIKTSIAEQGIPEIVSRLRRVETATKVEVPEGELTEWDDEGDETGEDDAEDDGDDEEG